MDSTLLPTPHTTKNLLVDSTLLPTRHTIKTQVTFNTPYTSPWPKPLTHCDSTTYPHGPGPRPHSVHCSVGPHPSTLRHGPRPTVSPGEVEVPYVPYPRSVETVDPKHNHFWPLEIVVSDILRRTRKGDTPLYHQFR